MTLEQGDDSIGRKVRITQSSRFVMGYGCCFLSDDSECQCRQRVQCEQWFRDEQSAGRLQGYAWGGWWFEPCSLSSHQWFHRAWGQDLLPKHRRGDKFVVASIDRAITSWGDLRESHRVLKEAHVTAVYVAQGIDTSVSSPEAIARAWAEFEPEIRRRRAIEPMRHRQRNGMPINGFAPLGWKKYGLKSESSFKPDYQERRLCNYIVELKEVRGLSFAEIQIHFRKCGVTHHHMNRRDFQAKLAAGERWGWSAERVWRGYHAAKAGFPKTAAKDMLAELRANGGLLRAGRATRSHY